MFTDQPIPHRNELYRQGRAFLSDFLAAGPQPYMAIVARAAEAGISLATLLTAKRALHVESRKIGRSTIWYLPPAV